MHKLFKIVLSNLEIVFSGLFLIITISVVILNVILRYGFQSGLFWVEEVATMSFIWCVFIGAAAAYKYKMHIGIDIITQLFPEKMRELISIIVNFIIIAINCYIFYLSLLFIQSNRLKRTSVLDIPSLYVNMAISVGFGLMAIHSFQFLIKEARMFFGNSKELQKDGV